MATSLRVQLDAVRTAIAAFDYESAQQKAELLIASVPPLDAAAVVIAEAHLLAAQAQYRMGRFAPAGEHYRQGAELYASLNDAASETACRIGIAKCAHHLGDLARAEKLATQALKEAREHRLKEQEGHALSALGTVAWKRGDADTAIARLRQAAQILDRLGLWMEANKVRGSLGVALISAGQVEEAAKVTRRVLSYFKEAGDARAVVKALMNMGFVAYSLGEYSAARSYLKRCTKLEEQLGDPGITATSFYNLGLVELQDGNHRSAKKPFTRAYHLAQQVDDQVMEGSSLTYLALIAIYEKLPDEALNLLQLSIAKLAGTQSTEWALAKHYLPAVYLANGLADLARQAWDERPVLTAPGDCMDDLGFINRALGFLRSEEYGGDLQLDAGALKLAAAWSKELEKQLALRKPPERINLL
jgi:tetratricopeptide (TPR) repeat protein